MGTRATTADTAPKWLTAYRQHSRTVEKALLTLNLALFTFCVADWLGWLPWERGFQPLRMVYWAGALVLLPVASLIQRRSMLASFVLLAASMALLVISVAVRR